MPNVLDAFGLQFYTRAEWIAIQTAWYQEIYGADVNLASDTPDGQMMNIQIQAFLDVQDLLAAVYNSFDPDQAVGVTLDQRVTINGIQRQAGTYTVTAITVVTNRSLNIPGLDLATDETDAYTVADNQGTLWRLMTSQVGLAAGTHVLNFRAALPGATLTVPNTINVPVTIILGVVSVNNPTTYTTLGVNEETDTVLRVRRQKSVSLPSQGYLEGLIAALENIDGVTSAYVYENNTNVTDSDGTPGHTIWVIVAGAPDSAEVAQAIYRKRNAGAGMRGETEYTVVQVDSTLFTVYWDTVVTRNVFIAFTVTPLDGETPVNVQAIRDGLVVLLHPTVNQSVNINGLATLVQDIDPNALVTNAGFTTGVLQTAALSGVAASGTFKINYNGNASAAINWNDSVATIQSKVRSVSGLSAVDVTGSIASQSLVFDLDALDTVLGLLTVTNNSLLTAGAAAITFAWNENYTAVLSPPSKREQLVVSAANVVILPMQLLPSSSAVETGDLMQMTTAGGYGTIVYSIFANNSGATINASTGLYTAGGSPGTDTLRATDAFGNYIAAIIVVS